MEEEAQAQVDVWKYALGFSSMHVVQCTIELGIPDVLENHGSPMTLSKLSTAVGCPEASLFRIMRFLIHQGIFKKQISSSQKDPTSIYYTHTPLSRLLTRDKMGSFVLVQAGPPGLQLGLTAKDLRAGKGSGLEAFQTNDKLWSPELAEAYGKLFQDFFIIHAKLATSAMIANHPESFKGIDSLVDVGGRHGTALRIVVEAFPQIRGINFDLPDVVSGASPIDGVEHVGGSMFESVPRADAVMLMWILHDWSDELCINILTKCKEAIPVETGKVIIVEAVIDEEGGDEYTGARLALDMAILSATVTGKERTAKEWAQLLNAAGFSRHTIKPMKALESVIEAYP